MSIQYKQDDFVLLAGDDDTEKTNAAVHKYDAFLSALTTPDFAHVRRAVRQTVRFFVSEKFSHTEALARHTYQKRAKLQTRYPNIDDYLDKLQIKNKKAASIDLATGTGKSWVIYGVAQIMLAEGIIDKVLVLCPSLTIEEELRKKFSEFSGDQPLTQTLQEVEALYPSPAIKNANETIQNGDICVENVHAVYQRTGSSIADSFKGKGQRTLVISDEAHHIYSPGSESVKKWFGFITNNAYDFAYLLGVTGTPYIDDEYFHDVIFRYGLKQAMEDEVIKSIDYKVEEESERDKGFAETYQNHLALQEQYASVLKPISIVITDRIVTCIEVWHEFVKYLSEKESITYEQAAKKAIWVTSGIPSNKAEKKRIEDILTKPEKERKANLAELKTVDEDSNPVEWIFSVSMLTEGWDVKKVFQIVPHEQRAFNSKLLIAQVLGRGLRIPRGLDHPVAVKINNHEKWTQNIVNLYNEILEIENRMSWGYDPRRSSYLFDLYNLEYESVEDTTEVKKKSADEPEKVRLKPQSREWEETSIYKLSGEFKFTVNRPDVFPIEQAVREIKLFLKDKDAERFKDWTSNRIKDFITSNLKECGYDDSFVSGENLAILKQSFGPMFRDEGKETPRMKMKPEKLFSVSIEEMARQSFNESAVKNHAYLFYTSDCAENLPDGEKNLLENFANDKNNIDEVRENIARYGGDAHEVDFLETNFCEIDANKMKCPLDMLYVTYEPEYRFTKSLFHNIELFDSVFKAPDKGFYSFPYSYKPSETGSTHVKRENFNPDFFLKNQNNILVIEIKADGDNSQKNKAKYRDAKKHFNFLNDTLAEEKIDWKYHFFFLSKEDYTDFFQAVRDKKFEGWKSQLMQFLE